MRFVSRIPLALALAAAGTMAVTVAPDAAFAQKKQAEAPKVSISKEIRPQVAEIQKAIEENPAAAKPLVEQLLAQGLTGDDQFVAGQLAIQVGSALKDQGLQEKGINASLDSGRTGADQAPSFNFFAGNFAYGANRFGEARQRFERAYELGYRENNVGALIAESYFKENRDAEGLAALERAIAAETSEGRKADESWYRRGAAIAMKSVPADSGKWTYKLVDAYPTGENWRAALSVYRDSATPALSNRENLELMRLMRQADAMESERDYYEYAEAADYRRLPGEVVSVLEEGIAKNDFAPSSAFANETLGLAKAAVAADRASLAASERDAKSAADGDIALATADAFLGYSDYQKAGELYQTALTKGGVDANRANMGLGIARVGQQDWTGAKAAFANVNGQRANIARFWTLWIDQQALDGAPAIM